MTLYVQALALALALALQIDQTTSPHFTDLSLDMSAMSVSSAKQVTSDPSGDVTDDRQPSVFGLHSPSSTAPPVTIKPGIHCMYSLSCLYIGGMGACVRACVHVLA